MDKITIVEQGLKATAEIFQKSLQSVTDLSQIPKINTKINSAVQEIHKVQGSLAVLTLLRDMALYFKRKGARQLESTCASMLRLKFEIGPQYNDEGYDVRICYEGTSLECLGDPDLDSQELSDHFSDYYYDQLDVDSFEYILTKNPSTEWSQNVEICVTSPALVIQQLLGDCTGTAADILQNIRFSTSAERVDVY